MPRSSYKESYEALVANADRAAAKAAEEINWLKSQLHVAHENMAGWRIKVELIKTILGLGKKEGE